MTNTWGTWLEALIKLLFSTDIMIIIASYIMCILLGQVHRFNFRDTFPKESNVRTFILRKVLITVPLFASLETIRSRYNSAVYLLSNFKVSN